MFFKNFKDLSDDIEAWMPNLPPDLECIVGIPRSGMLVANLLALKLNLPVTDLEGLLSGNVMAMGHRFDNLGRENFLSVKRKVFVVDDSLSSGRAINQARAQVEGAGLPHDVVFGCVYGSTRITVDWCCVAEIVPHPRRFEWNIFSSEKIENYCFDMDGVICCDPSEAENDDGERYRAFIRGAKPLYRPVHKIGYIVTSRLERYRAETEEWLARQGITYGRLFMLDLPTMSDRRGTGAGVAFKAEVYREMDANLFIESHYSKAQQIVNLSRRCVYSVDRRMMISPGRGVAACLTRSAPAIRELRRWRNLARATCQQWMAH